MSRSSVWFFLVSLLVGIGGVLYGYDIGVISGALLLIKQSIPMTDTQTGLMVGAVLWGGLIGTLVAGPIADNLGRRAVIALSCVIFIIGVICILSANTFITLLVARVLLGVGVGVVAVAVPLYVTEIVPPKHRGKYVSFFQLFLTLGIVLAYVVDYHFIATGNWRLMFAVILVPALLLLLAMLVLPESPRWLMVKQRDDRALRILQRLVGPVDALQMQQEIRSSLQQVSSRWRDLSSRRVIFPLLLGIAVAILNQWTGVNSFLQYAPYILKSAGIASNRVAMLGSIGIGVLNCVGTLLGLLLVDRIGRRRLLIVGIAGVVLSELLLGVLSLVVISSQLNGLLSLIGLFGFIFSFAIGPGLIVWLVFAELLPTAIRGKGIAVCLFFSSCSGALLASFFLDIQHALGLGHSYFLFAFCSLCYLALSYYCLPEAKGRSLEDIQQQYDISFDIEGSEYAG